MTIDRPTDLRINASDGEESPILDFPASPGAPVVLTKSFAPRFLPKPWDWRSPDVGWGMVLLSGVSTHETERVS